MIQVKELKFDNLVEIFHKQLEKLPDYRKASNNTTYEIKDGALGAFAVFFTQSPSFLAYQKRMEERKGKSNAESLFGIEKTPSMPQIRNLLDAVEANNLYEIFRKTLSKLKKGGKLSKYRDIEGTILLAIDGMQYYSSQKINCEQCYRHKLANGEIQYSHSVITPVIVKGGMKEVIPLEPEFILPQDGHDKQDCETQAMKRWLKRCGQIYSPYKMTLLGDDIYAHQPLCEAVLAEGFNFIFVCKPGSHHTLYHWLDFLQAKPEEKLPTITERHWNGRYAEIWTYRYMNDLPLRDGADALYVNWCELTISREDTGEQLYHNSWVTNFELDDFIVKEVAQAGRARWKVENENNNVLKNRGYHIGHNFGHGKQHLSTTLLTLNLLAFLFHTVLHLVDVKYQLLRDYLSAREQFFNDIKTLTRYLFFDSWDDLLNFMISQLEIPISFAPT